MSFPETDVYVMGGDGTGVRLLVAHDAPGVRLETPVWAPDGKSIYVSRIVLQMDYTILRDVLSGVTRVSLEGGEQVTVVPEGSAPAISPDGNWVACTARGSEGVSLLIGSTDGQRVERFVRPGGLDEAAAPRFSPDGRRLLFTAVSPDGAPATPPSGRPLAFVKPVRAHGLPTDLFVMDRDGSDLRRVTRSGFDDAAGVWSPDGRRIAILTRAGIFTANEDGSQLTLIDRQGGYGNIDWRSG
jgi:TolB protein